MTYPPEVEKMLDADIVAIAATAFVATFTGVKLGGEAADNKVLKSVKAQYGNPPWHDVNSSVYEAVALDAELIYQRARVAGRSSESRLKLLVRGVALLAAPDPTAALRELL